MANNHSVRVDRGEFISLCVRGDSLSQPGRGRRWPTPVARPNDPVGFDSIFSALVFTNSPIGPAIIDSIIGIFTVPRTVSSWISNSAAIFWLMALIDSVSRSSLSHSGSTVPPPGIWAASFGSPPSILRRASAFPKLCGMSNCKSAMKGYSRGKGDAVAFRLGCRKIVKTRAGYVIGRPAQVSGGSSRHSLPRGTGRYWSLLDLL